MKLLLIDDDHLVRHMVAKMLRNQGHEVATAADGARAMAIVGGERSEVVITDIIMPEQEGFETIIRPRRDYPHIKIVAISGGFRGGNLEVLSMAHHLGADDVLAIPFEEDDLRQALDRVTA